MASHSRKRRLSDPGAAAAAPAISGLHEVAALAAAASTLFSHHHEGAGVHAGDASLPAVAAAIAAAHARKGNDRTVAALGPASHRLRWGMSHGAGAEEAATSAPSPRAGGRDGKRAVSPAATGERAGPPPSEAPSAAAATRPMSAARLIQLQRSTTPITIGKASHHQQVLTAATPRTTGAGKDAGGSPRRGGAKSPSASGGGGSSSQRKKGSSSPRKSPLRVHPAIPAPNAVRSSALEAAVRDSYFPCVRRAARLWAIDQGAMRAVHLGALRDALLPEGAGGEAPTSGGGVAGAGARGWVESRVSVLSARELRAVAEGPDPSALYEAEAGRDGQPQHRYAASDAPRAGADLVVVRRLRTRELLTGRLLPVTGGEGLVGGSSSSNTTTNPLLPSSGQGFKGVWAVAPFPAPARAKREEEGEGAEAPSSASHTAAASSAPVSGLPSLFAMRLTPTLLLRRDGLRFHPRLVATSHRAWKLARRYSLRARAAALDQETYVAFFSRVVAARRDVLAASSSGARRGPEAAAPPSNATAADVSAVRAAWAVDSCGLAALPFGLFQIAWFLAADTTPGLEPEVQAYAAVLEGILAVLDPKGATKAAGRAARGSGGAGEVAAAPKAATLSRPRAGSAPPALAGGASFRRHRAGKGISSGSTLSVVFRDASAPLQEGAARYLRALPRYWGYVTACSASGTSNRAVTAATVRAALCRTELRPQDKGVAPALHHMAVPDERRAEEVEALAPALLRPALAPPTMLGVAVYKEAVAAAAAAAAVAKIGARGIGRPTSAAAIAAAAAAAAAVNKQMPGGDASSAPITAPAEEGNNSSSSPALKKGGVTFAPSSPVPIAFAPVIAPAPLVIPPVITKSVDGRGSSGIIMAAPLSVLEVGGGGPRGIITGSSGGLYGSLEAETLVVEGEEPGMWGDIELSYALPTSSRPSMLLTPGPSIMLVGGTASVSGAETSDRAASTSASLLLSESGVHTQPSDSGEGVAVPSVQPPSPAPVPVSTGRSASPIVVPPSPPSPSPAAAAPTSPTGSAGRSASNSPVSPPSPPSPGTRSPGAASPAGSVPGRSHSGSPLPFLAGGGEEPTIGSSSGGGFPSSTPLATRTRSSSAVIDLNLQFAPPQQALYTGAAPSSPPPSSPPSPPPPAPETAFQAPALLAPGESLEELPLHLYHGKGSPTSTASPGMLAPTLYESPTTQPISSVGGEGALFAAPVAVLAGAGKIEAAKQPLSIIPEAKATDASSGGGFGTLQTVAASGESGAVDEAAAYAADADFTPEPQVQEPGYYGYEGGMTEAELLQQQGYEDEAAYYEAQQQYYQQQQVQYQGGYIPTTVMVPAGVPDVQLSAHPSLAGTPLAHSRPSSRGKPAAFGGMGGTSQPTNGPPPVQHIGPIQRRINDPVPSLAAQMMAALTRETSKIEKRGLASSGAGGGVGGGKGRGGAATGGLTDALPGPSPQRSAEGSERPGSPSGFAGAASTGHRDSMLTTDFAGIEGSESLDSRALNEGSPHSPLMPAGAGFSAMSLKGLDEVEGGLTNTHLLPTLEGGSSSFSEGNATLAVVSRIARAGSAEYQRLGDGVPAWKRTGLLPTGKAAPSPVLRKSRPASASGAGSASLSASGAGKGGRPRPMSAFPRAHRDGEALLEEKEEDSTAGGEGATARDSILFGSLMQSSDGGSDGAPLHALDGGPSVGMLLFSGGGGTGSPGGVAVEDETEGFDEDEHAVQAAFHALHHAKQPSASFDAAEAERDVFSEEGSRFGRDSPTLFSPQPRTSPLLVAIPGITVGSASGANGRGSPAPLLGSPVRLSNTVPGSVNADGAQPPPPSYTLYDAWAVYTPAAETSSSDGLIAPTPRVPAAAAAGVGITPAPGAAPHRHTPSPPAATASRSERGRATSSPASPALDIGLDHGELDLLAPPLIRRGGGSFASSSTVNTPTAGAAMPRAAWAGSLAAAANALFPQGPTVLKPLARDMLQQQQRPGSRGGVGLGAAPPSPPPTAPIEVKSSTHESTQPQVAASDSLAPLASSFTRATRVFTLESLLPPETADGSVMANASIGNTASAVLAMLPSLDAPLPPPPASAGVSGRPGSAARMRTFSSGSAGAGSRPTSAGRRPASASRGARPTTPGSYGRVMLSLEENGPATQRPRSNSGAGASGRPATAASASRPRSASRGGAADASASRFPVSVPRPGSPPGTLRSPRPGSAGRSPRATSGGGRAHDRVDAFLAQQQQEQLQLNLVHSSSNNHHRPGTAGTVGSPRRPTTPHGNAAAGDPGTSSGKPAGVVSSRGYRAAVETAPSLASTYVRWAKALKPGALVAAPPPDKGLTLSKSPLRGGGGAAAMATTPGGRSAAAAALGSSAQPGFAFGRAGAAFSGTDGDDWVLGGSGTPIPTSSGPEISRPTTPGRRMSGSSSPTKAARSTGAAGGGRLATGSNHRAASGAAAMLPPSRRMPVQATPAEGLPVLGPTTTPGRGTSTPGSRAGSSTAPRSPSPTRMTPRRSIGGGGLVPPPSPLAAAGARSLLRPSSAMGTPGGTGGLLLGRGSASVTSGNAASKPSGGISGFSAATTSGGSAAGTPRAAGSQGSMTTGTARSAFP